MHNKKSIFIYSPYLKLDFIEKFWVYINKYIKQFFYIFSYSKHVFINICLSCRPEFQRIAGSEMLETCYLVNELVLNGTKSIH